MTQKRVWLITGAGRGLGVGIAKAALAEALVELAALKVAACWALDAKEENLVAGAGFESATFGL